jgi:hypothetical protein
MMKKGQYTLESWMIANGKSGQSFYTEKKDKTITALAVFHKRKVKTERLITITTGGKIPDAQYITKVTLM